MDIFVVNKEEKEKADALATSLALPIKENLPEKGDFFLFYHNQKLYLQSIRHPEFKAFCLDFLSPEMLRKKATAATSKDLLIKAVGAVKKRPKILDCTLGLGVDSFLLMARNCEVWACERNKILSALWRDAAARANLQNIRFIDEDAKLFLKNTKENFDILYLDPMYPEKRKTAPKKEMLLLRELLGGDDDADKLFSCAWEKARERVVVKRPIHAEYLAGEKPVIQYRGKSIRYDVYLK